MKEVIADLIKTEISLVKGVKAASLGVAAVGLAAISGVISVLGDVTPNTFLAKVLDDMYPALRAGVINAIATYIIASMVDRERVHVGASKTDSWFSLGLGIVLFTTPILLLVYSAINLADASSMLKAFLHITAVGPDAAASEL
ncbi:hypothetical protein FHT87_005371 [Rhizobium sp. BK316]|uniref:hypothetical protein n=1 Tax=Rhizobium sp. BK316 TaxID=2587053 RepID=UPI0016217893|nr:hypothetical protein [Rhizobium sp. BK316]MBB3411418.1 hypothetical protein [Rhizobium sp. BK316]